LAIGKLAKTLAIVAAAAAAAAAAVVVVVSTDSRPLATSPFTQGQYPCHPRGWSVFSLQSNNLANAI
jgi:hypothetical protein